MKKLLLVLLLVPLVSFGQSIENNSSSTFLEKYNNTVWTDGISTIRFRKLSSINDSNIEPLLLLQIIEQNSRWNGGVKDVYQVPNAHSTMNFVIKLCSAFVSPHSKFYESDELAKAMTRAMKCIVSVQHEDGTIDLHSTNFHSTPDTAFFVNYLSPVYLTLKNLNQPRLVNLITNFELFLKKTSQNSNNPFV